MIIIKKIKSKKKDKNVETKKKIKLEMKKSRNLPKLIL
jgi:hypothetical protein